ncbi:MAG: DUF2358 domain-containing protein [Microcoleaceae cyanobacterium]
MNLVDVLRADYQRFPHNQTYSIYSKDVYFKDPLNEFYGIERYRQMIGFIQRWFSDIQFDLFEIGQEENTIITRWSLSWTVPFLWQPRITIPGWSQLQVNSESLIVSHIDYWDCSRLDVIKQLFRF